MSVPICPDCRQDYGPEAHVCPVSGGTRCPKCYSLCPDNEVEDNVCIDCFEAASLSDKRIDELIEASSLGTPAAKAFRESVSDEEAQRMVDRVNGGPKKLTYGDGPGNPHADRSERKRRLRRRQR